MNDKNIEMEVWVQQCLYPLMLSSEDEVNKLVRKRCSKQECTKQDFEYVNTKHFKNIRNNREKNKIVNSVSKLTETETLQEGVTYTSDDHLDLVHHQSSNDQELELNKINEFFQRSAEHKRKMADAKIELETMNYVLDTQGPAETPHPSHNAPSFPPGESRYSALMSFYGSHAQRIVSMETNLQAKFDRSVDECQPKYWPVIPLKF